MTDCREIPDTSILEQSQPTSDCEAGDLSIECQANYQAPVEWKWRQATSAAVIKQKTTPGAIKWG